MKQVKSMAHYRANWKDGGDALWAILKDGVIGVGLLIFLAIIIIPVVVTVTRGFYPEDLEEGHCDDKD